MYAAREKGHEAKVVGRWLHIWEEKYNSKNIPEELMDERNDNNSGWVHFIPIKLLTASLFLAVDKLHLKFR